MVVHALNVTPCHCAVISDVLDASLALEVVPEVLRAATDKDAHALAVMVATETHRPVLVIGEADFLDAVYADGHREPILKVQ